VRCVGTWVLHLITRTVVQLYASAGLEHRQLFHL